jgi:molybdopterin synthase sulfur carrier subunit
MRLKILFFGQLTEITRSTIIEENVSIKSVYQLEANFKIKFPELKNYKYQIAVNQKIISEDIILNEGDEIAFLPPFSGG